MPTRPLAGYAAAGLLILFLTAAGFAVAAGDLDLLLFPLRHYAAYALFLVVSFVFYEAGRLLLYRLLPPAGRLEKYCVCTATGLFAFGLLQYLLLMAQAWRAGLVWGVFLIFALVRVRAIALALREYAGWLGRLRVEGACLPPLAVIAVMLVAQVLLLGAPQTFFDTLTYHLAYPAQWSLTGGLGSGPAMIFNSYPALIEATMTCLMPRLDFFAGCLNHFFALLALLALLVLAREFGAGRPAALFVAAVVIVMPGFALLTVVVKNDTGTILCQLLGLLYLLRAATGGERSRDNKNLLLAALFAGFALLMKYTSVYFAAAGLAALAAAALAGRIAWRQVAAYALLVALLFAPVALRNFSGTGNPFYPMLPAVFGYAPDQVAITGTLGGGGWRAARDLLTVFPRLFLDGDAGGFGSFSTTSWLTGVLFAAGLLAMARHRALRLPALVFVTVYFSGWLATVANTRYAYGGLFAVMAAAAWPLTALLRRHAGQLLLFAALLVSAGWGFLVLDVLQYVVLDAMPVCLGRESRDAYLSRRLDYYRLVAGPGSRLAPADTVLMLGETRGYYAPCRVIASAAEDFSFFLRLFRDCGGDSAAFAVALRERGVTHLLVNDYELVRFRAGYAYHFDPDEAESAGLAEFISGHCELAARDGDVLLFCLRPTR